MNLFEKIDLAIEALKKAPQKSTLSPRVSNEDLEKMNNLLSEAQLPQMPLDVMYFLSKVGACNGPYCDIYGAEGLQGATDPEDITVIGASADINRDEDDDEPQGLVIGCIREAGLLPHYIVYKNEQYYQVEDERGTYTYFMEQGNLGDVIIRAIENAEKRKAQRDMAQARKDVEKWSE